MLTNFSIAIDVKIWLIIIFFTLKLLFESELYITFQVIYMINNFCFNFVDNLQKDLTRQQIDAKIKPFISMTWKSHCVTTKFCISLHPKYNIYSCGAGIDTDLLGINLKLLFVQYCWIYLQKDFVYQPIYNLCSRCKTFPMKCTYEWVSSNGFAIEIFLTTLQRKKNEKNLEFIP